MKPYSYTQEQLKAAVAQSTSYWQIHKKLGIKGCVYHSLKTRIKKCGFDTSHIIGCAKNSLSSILVKNSTYLNNDHLKYRLLRAGLKKLVCEECNLTDWLGKKLSFHLHHINGNYKDNRLSNLQFLCPNCHSQTDNFGVKNKGRGRPNHKPPRGR